MKDIWKGNRPLFSGGDTEYSACSSILVPLLGFVLGASRVPAITRVP